MKKAIFSKAAQVGTIFFIFAFIFLIGCSDSSQNKGDKMNKEEMKKELWGKTDNKDVYLFTLENKNGMKATITNYGGILTSLYAPDTNGNFDDVVLGFDSLSGYTSDYYIKNCPYFGALIGRYGNRIAKGEFKLDGKTYKLPINNGPNTLHGGIKGFDKVVWDADTMQTDEGPAVKLTYLSKDGEEGFPGNLNVTVIYTLTNNNELKIHYTATTDKPTVVNLTHHSYFNLSGQGNGNILNEQLMINADKYTPVNSELIPTGQIKDVAGTPFDFRKPEAIGSRIDKVEGGGYDHNFVLNDQNTGIRLAAKVYDPASKREMEVLTDEPGVQFYTGNFLDGSLTGKGGKKYDKHFAFCLETQHYPDSPNEPKFPSTVLNPGNTYSTTTIYKFSVK